MLGIIAITLALGATVRWFWRTYRVDIPANPRLFIAAWGAALLLGIFALLGARGGVLVWSAVGVSLLMLYLSATAKQKVGSHMIRVGDSIPAFTAIDEHGASFESASLHGSRVLLKFFRGHW